MQSPDHRMTLLSWVYFNTWGMGKPALDTITFSFGWSKGKMKAVIRDLLDAEIICESEQKRPGRRYSDLIYILPEGFIVTNAIHKSGLVRPLQAGEIDFGEFQEEFTSTQIGLGVLKSAARRNKIHPDRVDMAFYNLERRGVAELADDGEHLLFNRLSDIVLRSVSPVGETRDVDILLNCVIERGMPADVVRLGLQHLEGERKISSRIVSPVGEVIVYSRVPDNPGNLIQ